MSEGPITQLLDAAKAGDPSATDKLFSAVYGELKKLAGSHRARWHGNQTLNTTALIHEVFIKLAGQEALEFSNRTHFYATASRAMRHILVNYAERQNTNKRGGDAIKIPLDEETLAADASIEELLTLDELLSRLEKSSPRRCRIVECRVFGGMTIEETAEALGISKATVKRDWQVAIARLYQDLEGDA